MAPADDKNTQAELHALDGALDVLFTLREEFAQWQEEAQSEERKEELDNVYRHIDTMEQEYRRRREAAAKKFAQG